MTRYNAFNFLLEVLELLPRSLCHILNVLLLVKRQFKCSAVGVKTLQRLSVMQACFEEGWILRKAYTSTDAFVLSKGINTVLLQVHKTTGVCHPALS